MCSARKLEANRANAQLSTGPRSEEGKQRSAQNALTHGLSAQLLVPTEDQQTYEQHQQSFIDDLNPQSPLQLFMVQRLALLTRKLHKCSQAEANITNRANLNRIFQTRQANLKAQQDHAEYMKYRHTAKNPKPRPEPDPIPEPVPASDILLNRFIDSPDNSFTRLQRYESTAERSFFKTLQQFQQLKKAENEPTGDTGRDEARLRPPSSPPPPAPSPCTQGEGWGEGQTVDSPLNTELPNEPTNPNPNPPINELQNEPTTPPNPDLPDQAIGYTVSTVPQPDH